MASHWVKMPAARYPIGVGYNGRRTRCPGWSAMTDLRRFARAQVHSCSRQTKRLHEQEGEERRSKQDGHPVLGLRLYPESPGSTVRAWKLSTM